MQDAIGAALAAHLSLLRSEVAWEGRVYAPVRGRPYTAARVAALSNRPMGAGANPGFLWEGVWQLVAVHPAELGQPEAVREADLLRAHHPRALALPLPAGRRLVVEWAEARPAYASPDWINVPVNVRFFAEEPPSP